MSSICPNNNGPLCTTCKLGGLIRCPIMGVPLPLVEAERREVVINRKATKVLGLPEGMSEAERQRIYQWLKSQGHFE